jgi:hypothetical protein
LADNGIGLDNKKFEAFCTTDADHKIARGGKGVDRLLWLDAFEKIEVKSVYCDHSELMRRKFSFRLAGKEPIADESVTTLENQKSSTGTVVTFTGLRANAYRDKFSDAVGDTDKALWLTLLRRFHSWPSTPNHGRY